KQRAPSDPYGTCVTASAIGIRCLARAFFSHVHSAVVWGMNDLDARYHLGHRRTGGALAPFALFLLLSVFAASPARGQTPTEPMPDTSMAFVQDLRAVVDDARMLVRSTGAFGMRSIRNNSWYLAGGLVSEAALVFGGGDTSMRNVMMRNQSTAADRVMNVANIYGTTFVGAAVVGGVYLTGLAMKSPSWRTAGRRAGETLLLSGITTTMLKAIIGRARPYTNLGSTSVSPFAFHEDRYSWPSGHTTVAFAISSSLARSIDNPYVGALLYAGAAATGAARMYYDKHWLSDVMMGAAIGTISAQLVHSLDDPRETAAEGASNGTSLMIGPSIGGVNVMLAW
ncbi:MAG: phosphatase PAP2 family protein, partial [Candidatus Kapaibacterium sp.]